ncbi:hexitol phosphatase HxpB [Maribellus comscasis]|uniref:Hexitol phosphatase HxpB n=1 Tax=Maribellus comscasis TaxID=2681766 RepID=A0A6I6JZW2_9BACT|nr:hexitol phosphatase HxpB [Maribellus comscasis]QGY45702.1 hexitol phosphatase HxpB [Maribellus comscasis]
MIQKTKDKIEAFIFDMDGVIIDSEEIWKRAEKEVFSSIGVKLSEELCSVTQSMTTTEVTNFWYSKYPWKHKTLDEVENGVVERVAHFIKNEGQAISGIEKFIKVLNSRGYKIGLATNSPSVLIPVVLEKLALTEYFDATSSAEHELEGKPHPFVYLTTAEKLNVKPENCVAIEDSFSGLLAAKKAGMKTIAIFDSPNSKVENKIADYYISCYNQFDFSKLNLEE